MNATKTTKLTFTEQGTFAAVSAAEAWCRENGISVGSMQRGSPRGLMRGDCAISKWRNLSKSDRKMLDGTMTGDMRNGPVVIEISEQSDAAD